MNAVQLRNSLHQYIDIADDKLLKMLKVLIETYTEEDNDWWNELSEEERADIDKGLEQANNDELVEHKAVMKVFNKWR